MTTWDHTSTLCEQGIGHLASVKSLTNAVSKVGTLSYKHLGSYIGEMLDWSYLSINATWMKMNLILAPGQEMKLMKPINKSSSIALKVLLKSSRYFAYQR